MLSDIQGVSYWINRPLKDEKKDWDYRGTWIDGYWESREHPHRNVILYELSKLKFASLLEVGCSCGPNLSQIFFRMKIPKLAGIDPNQESIERGKKELSQVRFDVGKATLLPYKDKEFDVVLADAMCMYLDKDEMSLAAKEFERVAKKAIVIVDWFSEEEEIKDFHWARNYKQIFDNDIFKTSIERQLKYQEWPTEKWEKNGRLFVFLRR